MECFYDQEIYKTTQNKVRNEIGQLVESYQLSDFFYGDIQPIDEKSYKYTWGGSIKSTYQLFCNENIEVNKILVYDDKNYKIEKKIKWNDYSIYALEEVDVKWQ